MKTYKKSQHGLADSRRLLNLEVDQINGQYHYKKFKRLSQEGDHDDNR